MRFVVARMAVLESAEKESRIVGTADASFGACVITLRVWNQTSQESRCKRCKMLCL